MRAQTALGCVICLAASAAGAQADGALRWRAQGSSVGLRPAPELQLPCGPLSLACKASSTLPLYASEKVPGSLSMQVGSASDVPLKIGRAQGLSLNLVGRAGLMPELDVYGRIGRAWSAPGSASLQSDGNVSYGVGLSWALSRSASAVVGWDSYDFRRPSGDSRDFRATSLGLQWRY